MTEFNAQSALSHTYFEALKKYHSGGLTNGGGIAGIQRPQLDRFDESGAQIVKSAEMAVQPKRGDRCDPKAMTQWVVEAGKNKPKFTAPAEDPELNQYLQKLAEKLAAMPGQTYMVPAYLQGKIDADEVARTEAAFAAENYPSDISLESKELQETRKQIRQHIAQAAAGTVSADPEGYLDTALNMIQDPEIKSAVKLALTHAKANTEGGQHQFFEAPSSGSGMFHPADEINKGGLALHSLRDVQMGDWLCQIYNVKGKHRDIVIGALAVHDIEKGGEKWNGYAGDHGPIAQRYLEHIWKVPKGTPDDAAHPMKRMAVAVGRHMAQWNTSPPPEGKKYGNKDPLPPQNLIDQLVSWGDYLGALDNVYLDAPQAAA